jgi:hypothetical protein
MVLINGRSTLTFTKISLTNLTLFSISKSLLSMGTHRTKCISHALVCIDVSPVTNCLFLVSNHFAHSLQMFKAICPYFNTSNPQIPFYAQFSFDIRSMHIPVLSMI